MQLVACWFVFENIPLGLLVIFLIRRQGYSEITGGNFVSTIGIPLEYSPKAEKREVRITKKGFPYASYGQQFTSNKVSSKLHIFQYLGDREPGGFGSGEQLPFYSSDLLCCQKD